MGYRREQIRKKKNKGHLNARGGFSPNLKKASLILKLSNASE